MHIWQFALIALVGLAFFLIIHATKAERNRNKAKQATKIAAIAREHEKIEMDRPQSKSDLVDRMRSDNK